MVLNDIITKVPELAYVNNPVCQYTLGYQTLHFQKPVNHYLSQHQVLYHHNGYITFEKPKT